MENNGNNLSYNQYKTNMVFRYNEFFNTDLEEMLDVFDALVKRGRLHTFRVKALKTNISGKKTVGVLNYFMDLGLVKVVDSNQTTLLYQRIFEVEDADKIRKNLEMDKNLKTILSTGQYDVEYGETNTENNVLFKTLYAYLRWHMCLHRMFKAKYFDKREILSKKFVKYFDCPLNNYQFKHAMLYGIKKGYVVMETKRSTGSIYSFDRSFLVKKIPISEVI